MFLCILTITMKLGKKPPTERNALSAVVAFFRFMTFGSTSQIVSTINLKFIYRHTLRFYIFPCLSTGIPIHFNGTLYFDFYYSVVVVAVRLATWQILLSLPRCRSIPEWRVVMLLQGSRSRNRGSPWCSFSVWTFIFKRFPPCNRL